MKALLQKLALASVLLLSINGAHAIPILAFDPVDSFASTGDSVFVDLTVSLEPFETIGDFDITFNYDADIVSLTNITFGSELNFSGLSLQGYSIDNISGTGNIAEISFDPVVGLDFLQSDFFTLATMEFSADAQGLSPLTFDDIILGDEFGLGLPFIAGAGSICVDDCTVNVPEPGTLALLGLGLVGLFLNGVARRKT